MAKYTSFIIFTLTAFILLITGCKNPYPADTHFGIKVLDKGTGRAIPLVQLKTLNSLVWHSDNAGVIAFDEPDLMHVDMYFEIKSAGYRYPLDKTGRQGVSLRIVPGKDTTLYLQRLNIAERLYRITGPGQFVHSNRLLPEKEKINTLKGGVLGQDSNLGIPYKGRIFWAWGDSFLPSQYRGNFSVAAGWSEMPGPDTWTPEKGIDFQYMVDQEGLSRPMINLEGPGYVWFDWLMNIAGENGGEKLLAKYSRVNAFFGNYERGVAVFDDEQEVFEKYADDPAWIPDIATMDHPFRGQAQGQEYYFTTSEFLFTRVKPILEEIAKAANYEVFSPFQSITADGSQNPKIERDREGKIKYGWKKDVPRLNYPKQRELISEGLISLEESHIHTIDMNTGEEVDVSRGSISWNPYRQRWVLIAGKQDVWYGEADTPVGPWVYVTKVASHDQFFYNPVHHSFLDQEGGRRIFFQGTFTKFFSKEPPIPRYDYNQLMYGLSLDLPHLQVPVPVYDMTLGGVSTLGLRSLALAHPSSVKDVSFFALEKSPDHPVIIPIYQEGDALNKLSVFTDEKKPPMFYAVRKSFDKSDFYVGNWMVKIAFKSFDNSVEINLDRGNNGWKISSSKPSFEFSNLVIDGTRIEMDLQHQETTYELSGNILAGELIGNFKLESGNQGSWTAQKSEQDWWPILSNRVVPLYEYRDNSGTYRYTTDMASNAERSILCLVWENPSTVLAVDFDIAPISR